MGRIICIYRKHFVTVPLSCLNITEGPYATVDPTQLILVGNWNVSRRQESPLMKITQSFESYRILLGLPKFLFH